MRKKRLLILATLALAPAFLSGCGNKETPTYTANFYDWDSTLLSTLTVKQGESAAYTGATPTRVHDEQYSYTFSGWDQSLDNIQKDVLFHAVYAKEAYTPAVVKYNVDFHNYDGTLLTSASVESGKFATYNGETPKRTMDEENTYAFKGWDKDLTKYAITENTTFTAQYSATARVVIATFMADFVNWDGSLISEQIVKKGEYAKAPNAPIHSQDETNTYAFKAWDKDPATTPIVANTTFVAQFDATVRQYHVTFVNYDGELLDEMDVKAGEKAVTTIPNPERPATSTLSYTFAGWNVNPEDLPIYANTTFVAQYNSREIAAKYEITFRNYDGAILLVGYAEAGHFAGADVPGYKALSPVRPSEGKTSYAFAGWNIDPASYGVTGPMTFTATYTATTATVSYPVEFRNYDGQLLLSSTVEEGKTCSEAKVNYSSLTPTRAEGANEIYTFAGWDQDPAALAITKATTFFAKYSTTKFYTVKFLDYDWSTLRIDRFAEGDQITYNNTIDPTRPDDESGSYDFAGWDEPLGKATKDKTYVATYTKTARTYAVRFLNYDGSVMATQKVIYGTYATLPNVTPTRVSDLGFVYTFKDWGVDLTKTPITHATDFYATFTSAKRTYAVRFLDVDGTVLATRDVAYGDAAGAYDATGAVPVQDSDPDCFYQFANWDSDPTTTIIDHNVDFHAVYKRVSYASAYTFKPTVGGTEYMVSGVNLDGYPTISNWEVPSTYQGLPVTVIANSAFKTVGAYASHVQSVNLPDSIAYIQEQAFAGSDIQELYLGDQMTVVQKNAFIGCTAFKKFDVSAANTTYSASADGQLLLKDSGATLVLAANSLENIVLDSTINAVEYGAIKNCPNLVGVTLENPDMEVANLNAPDNFINCPLLTSFTTTYAAGVNGKIVAQDGVLYGGTSLVRYPQGKTGDFTIPYSVTIGGTDTPIDTIASYAFYQAVVGKVSSSESAKGAYDCPLRTIGDSAFEKSGVTTVKFHDCASGAVMTVGEKAFYQCAQLTSLEIYFHLSTGAYAFSEDTALAKVYIEGSGTGTYVFGDYAFSGDGLLADAYLPSFSATSYGTSAFKNCTLLTFRKGSYFSVSPAVLGTSKGVFENCTALTGVVLDSAYASTDLPDATFSGCTSLTKVFFNSTNAATMATAKAAYHGNGNLVLNSATWYLFADTQPATNPENYWHYVNAVPTVWTAA